MSIITIYVELDSDEYAEIVIVEVRVFGILIKKKKERFLTALYG